MTVKQQLKRLESDERIYKFRTGLMNEAIDNMNSEVYVRLQAGLLRPLQRNLSVVRDVFVPPRRGVFYAPYIPSYSTSNIKL